MENMVTYVYILQLTESTGKMPDSYSISCGDFTEQLLHQCSLFKNLVLCAKFYLIAIWYCSKTMSQMHVKLCLSHICTHSLALDLSL